MENKEEKTEVSLEKEVVLRAPAKRPWPSYGTTFAIAILSILANMLIGDSLYHAKEQKEAAFRENDALRASIDEYRADATKAHGDIIAMTGVDAPQGLLDDATVGIYRDCLRNPAGLVLSPERLGVVRVSWLGMLKMSHLRIQNPDTIVNRSGKKFGYGDECEVEDGAMIKIASMTDSAYVLAFEVPGDEGLLYDCPSSAIRLVDRHNEVIRSVIHNVCMSRALLSVQPR